VALKPYWQDEKHDLTIYHGDCLEVLPKLEREFDLCLTDPPYGEMKAEWDEAKPPDTVWDVAGASLIDGGALYYWGFWRHAGWVLQNADRVGLNALSRIIWWYATGRPEAVNYRQDTETAWYFGKGQPRTFNAEAALEPYDDEANYERYGRAGKHPGTVWRSSRIFHNHPENVGHPTQKPLDIIERMVTISSNRGDTVIDPFLGSGTTLAACYRLGRSGVGIEISEEYCQLSVERLEKEIQQGRLFEPEDVVQKPSQMQIDV